MWIDKLKKVKQASTTISCLSDTKRNQVLHELAFMLRDHIEEIIAANAKDLACMNQNDPRYDRLLLNENRINAMAKDIERICALANPLGKVLQHTVMPNELIINKITVPLGVVAVIYESRPNVTIDVFSLCFKSGNACVLKGGKEAEHTNMILISLIQAALLKQEITSDPVLLFSSKREDTPLLLNAQGLIDVCIPRGSKALIDFVRQNATLPILETGAGVVHLYFDLHGDITKGPAIIHNSKTRRVSVCNALDCLLIHQARLDDLYTLIRPLEDSQVEILADEAAYQALTSHYPAHLLFRAEEDDDGKEFLSYKMAIKTLDSIEAAVQYIMNTTSGHTEGIITEESQSASYFTQSVDAAVIYINASTAFTDGGEFGMGAEIGISTQKLHARGPMGLDALTSYKWVVDGKGHIRR